MDTIGTVARIPSTYCGVEPSLGSPESKKAQDEENDDHEADDVDDTVHGLSLPAVPNIEHQAMANRSIAIGTKAPRLLFLLRVPGRQCETHRSKQIHFRHGGVGFLVRYMPWFQ
ncbi:hypothetical protein HKCCE2091_18900 [Rhodobacterales bacterium HKCCE2091]|nr:hypothetical protein [Rhodobacterales bacterium HKCCE2091]